ncbi:MAG: hypothetical protein C5B56_04020 [Proteobacteria bacterium]|nr:MAG: hypothetical protein C5B56_04020 [Pseudomonadota bacterium]
MNESNGRNAVVMDGSAAFVPGGTRAVAFVRTEICDDLASVLARICDDLNIVADRTAKEIIAIRLIELAQSGIRDPAVLRRRLLDEAAGGTGC